jgi:hypothetical protein
VGARLASVREVRGEGIATMRLKPRRRDYNGTQSAFADFQL